MALMLTKINWTVLEILKTVRSCYFEPVNVHIQSMWSTLLGSLKTCLLSDRWRRYIYEKHLDVIHVPVQQQCNTGQMDTCWLPPKCLFLPPSFKQSPISFWGFTYSCHCCKDGTNDTRLAKHYISLLWLQWVIQGWTRGLIQLNKNESQNSLRIEKWHEHITLI